MEDLLIFAVVATVVFLLMASFVVSYILLFQKKKIQNAQEKADLKARFEQETLNAKNEVQEATMRHIARELHDNISQLLFLVKIQLNTFEVESEENKRISDSKEFLNQAIFEISGLSKTLNSDNILAAGLAEAIKFDLQRIQKTGFIRTNFINETTNWNIDPKAEIIIFRIFQESVQNVIKHAKATNVTVRLLQHPKSYILRVEDDGVGFDTARAVAQKGFKSGAGLANLQSRAKLISGSMEVNSILGKGTTTMLTIPQATATDDNPSPRL